ncbi:glutathione S-transferase [Neolentinus lepideus HHB14362 ss-1]|uniref:glutathione transferase n=1 Tax=Neolentinus lepideus HHB14362 ss-1 TaxID=1314782 RepID=A0A165VPT2_9AGAM|nr:glutathione S-transferase [Neolentinus lepideus HHB14362 ss-1]
MVLQPVGSPYSTCTRRVAVVCKELGIPYELKAIDLSKGEHKSAEFVAKQPFGQVPYIDDDGFVLFESRAIGRYLALKAGSDLLPRDVKAQAKFEQAASIELTNFDPFASGIAAEKVFKPRRGVQTDPARVQEYATALEGKLDAYEKILAIQKYLAGDEITLADLFHLTYGAMLAPCGFSFLEDGKRPNVARWWKDITDRPSWQAVKDQA